MCLCFLNFHTAKLFPMTDFSNTGLACPGKWDASFGKWDIFRWKWDIFQVLWHTGDALFLHVSWRGLAETFGEIAIEGRTWGETTFEYQFLHILAGTVLGLPLEIFQTEVTEIFPETRETGGLYRFRENGFPLVHIPCQILQAVVLVGKKIIPF